MSYVFGVPELDKKYSSVLKPGSLLVIAGHPGSGKTTFAVTICYHNAQLGFKTLYLTLQEDRDKLYSVMNSLGMNLKVVEDKGLFKFVKIPVTLDIRSLSEWIIREINEYKPDILVIDSINAILESVDEREQRAWLQNFFYSIHQRGGLTILIAELPYGSEKLKLGSIEFVADAIFVLKHRVEESVLARTIEIRKTRGSPITVAEFPFTILANRGFVAYPPPYLEEIPYEGEEISLPFKTLSSKLGNHIHRGFVIYFAYPPDAKNWIPYSILLGLIVYHDMKAYIVSYNYPETYVREFIQSLLSRVGLNNSVVESIVNNRVFIKSINPYAYSISQIYAVESSMIEEKVHGDRVDIVVFDDVATVASTSSEYFRYLYNQLQLFKKHGLIIFRIGSIIDELNYRLNSFVSDMVFRFIPEYDSSGVVKMKLYVWRRRRLNPVILTDSEVSDLVNEFVEIAKSKFRRT